MPKRPAKHCPVARALALVGDRWTLLLLRDLQVPTGIPDIVYTSFAPDKKLWLGLRYIRRPLPFSQVALVSFIGVSIGHSVGFSALSSGASSLRTLAMRLAVRKRPSPAPRPLCWFFGSASTAS